MFRYHNGLATLNRRQRFVHRWLRPGHIVLFDIDFENALVDQLPCCCLDRGKLPARDAGVKEVVTQGLPLR